MLKTKLSNTLFCLFALLGFTMACQTNKIESFKDFRVNFYSDSIFQRSRIVFPLSGINTEEMTMEDTVYYWKDTDWKIMLKEIPLEGLKKEVIKTDIKVTEKIYQEDSGFSIISIFQLQNGKWYLVRYEIHNT